MRIACRAMQRRASAISRGVMPETPVKRCVSTKRLVSGLMEFNTDVLSAGLVARSAIIRVSLAISFNRSARLCCGIARISPKRNICGRMRSPTSLLIASSELVRLSPSYSSNLSILSATLYGPVEARRKSIWAKSCSKRFSTTNAAFGVTLFRLFALASIPARQDADSSLTPLRQMMTGAWKECRQRSPDVRETTSAR